MYIFYNISIKEKEIDPEKILITEHKRGGSKSRPLIINI